MDQQNVPYHKTIFVCVNDRKGERPSCGDQQGEKIFEELRRIAKERGLHPKIRVTQAKCLGQCSLGANVMIYPEQIWFSKVQLDDVPKITEQFLKKEKSDEHV